MAEGKKNKTWLLLLLLGLAGGGAYLYFRSKKKKREAESAATEKPKTAEVVQRAFEGLTFATGKATINPASYPSLDDLAAYLISIPALELSIEGHTDSVGDEDANLKLSKARAEAVKQYLVGKGVAESRIKAVGFGETRPVADNATTEGRNKNRRVEFKIA